MRFKEPAISAVLVNYNHAAFLSGALTTALNQTIPFDEIIVIDDASTDNSVEVIRQLIAGMPHARLVQNPKNLGVIATLNVGLQEASGDFIYYMSADDSYSPHIVECYRPALAQFPDVAMLSGNVCVCNTETGIDRPFALPFPQTVARYTRADLVKLAHKRAVTFLGGGNLIRRDAMQQAHGHLAELKWHADWFLYLLMACRHPFAIVPQEFIRIRQASDQYSHACYDWKKQKPVIEAFIHLLKRDYADAYDFFRIGALLPTYDIQALFLLLRDKTLNHYVTPLLVWRLLTYKPLRALGRCVPEGWRAGIRNYFRL